MRNIVIIGLKSIALFSLLLSIFLVFNQSGWISTLFLSLSVQITIFCIIIAPFLLLYKKGRHALYSLLAAILFSTQFIGLIQEDLDEVVFETTVPKLKIAHFNVLRSNQSKSSTIQTILNSEADVISLQETDQAWTSEIEAAVKEQYPHSIYFPSEQCCIGISLLSKEPLFNSNISFHGGLPNIEADMIFNGIVTHLITSHTSSPISRGNLENRNNHLKDLKKHVAMLDSPTIVIGDFNTVPWDNNLVAFKKESALIDSRKSYESTFPSFLGVAGIPIDYIFHTKEIACTSFETVQIKGSDHLGIIGEYAIH